MLVILFAVTGLGVGIVAFWQSTHQKDTTSSTKQLSCQFNLIQNVEILPAPEIFKPIADVTKLETTDLVVGTGDTVNKGDCIEVKYYGTLASDGQMFDEDFSAPEALKIQIGTGQVIPGWDEGIPGMKVGGVRRIVIPSDLAYGELNQDKIPANSDLVFVVKIEKIDK